MNKYILASVLAASLTSSYASAYSTVLKETTRGVVDSVDVEKNAVSIINYNTGEKSTVALQPSTQIKFGKDEYAGLSSLEVGHQIVIKKQTVMPMDRNIEGVIVSVNKEKFSARIRENDTKEVVEVFFNKDVKVSSLDESVAISANDFAGLRKGHTVKVGYSH